jgi:hypothetical protein
MLKFYEPLRTAELECIHAKTVETTMEQYIEIDNELQDLTGTASPTPTLTSTYTSTSTTSSDRRKTRRQTRVDSYARLPVTMPTSSDSQADPRRTSRSPQFLVPVATPRSAGRPGAPRQISRSWRGIDLHPRSTRLGAELRLRRQRLLCLWDTSLSDSTV